MGVKFSKTGRNISLPFGTGFLSLSSLHETFECFALMQVPKFFVTYRQFRELVCKTLTKIHTKCKMYIFEHCFYMTARKINLLSKSN